MTDAEMEQTAKTLNRLVVCAAVCSGIPTADLDEWEVGAVAKLRDECQRLVDGATQFTDGDFDGLSAALAACPVEVKHGE